VGAIFKRQRLPRENVAEIAIPIQFKELNNVPKIGLSRLSQFDILSGGLEN
jgi:hypothetical protein